MQRGERSTRFTAWLGRVGVLAPTLAMTGLLALSAQRLAGALAEPAGLVALALAAAAGLVASDLFGGVAHWACDRFGDERTPWIGPLVIAPFREHHVDPQILARKDFFDAASANAWLALALFGPWLYFVGAPRSAGALFLEACVASLCAAVFLTNTFHQWAHQPAPPRAARWLQRLRLAIPPERHALHHASGDLAYCVTTGWCNPALDRWRVFERLERASARLRGPRLRRSRLHG